ncbi:MAG: GTP-binding protein [Sedimenticolaceae bacterium]
MDLIPVNLITGFLGVGKTTTVRHLLANHPADEKWAVLVNEFGEVGVDGHLLAEQGVVVQEVAGGCLCCVAAPAFTTGLNRVIRQHRPDRILIEPSGLGHPAQVLDTLSGPLYAGTLEVRATLCLMDARHLSSPRHREHPNFLDQIHLADVLVANKTDLYTADDIAAFEDFVDRLDPAKQKIGRVEHGSVDPAWLDLGRSQSRHAAFPEAHAFLIGSGTPQTTEPAGIDRDWLLIEGGGDGYHSAGWMIRQQRPWSTEALAALIDALPAERKKGLFLTGEGWMAVNQSDWSAVSAPKDARARLELIHPQRLDTAGIERQLRELCALEPI